MTAPQSTPPRVKPIRQVVCSLCGGNGWRETRIDPYTHIGHGEQCVYCAGTGHILVEVEDA